MSDKMKNLEYVRNGLPRRVLLEGLAEECCELAQAALKAIRAEDGTNPTPVSKEACLDKLNEEAGDVLMLLDLLNMISCGSTLDNPKWERWANRIKDRNENTKYEVGDTFRNLCKALNMEFVLDESIDYSVQKDLNGDNCVYHNQNGREQCDDCRGDLFVALRNVAVNIFPNVLFRSAKYIYEDKDYEGAQ